MLFHNKHYLYIKESFISNALKEISIRKVWKDCEVQTEGTINAFAQELFLDNKDVISEENIKVGKGGIYLVHYQTL